jgi:hypothetical protein
MLARGAIGPLCAVLALAAVGLPPAHAGEPVAEAADRPRTVVFVGERRSIESMPDPCQERAKAAGVLDCISMDALYGANYRVVQPLVGDVAGEVVAFSVADHYGYPYFGYFSHALLFVELGVDGSWLHKYQAVPLLRTADGQWAACGDLRYRSDDDPLLAAARPMAFVQPLLRLGDLDGEARERLLPGWQDEPATYRIDAGEVHCLRGVPLEAAYAIVRDGVMAARGVELPPWPLPH